MIVGDVEQAFLDVGFGDALDRVAQFFGDQLGGVGVDHVGDLHHLALLHQHADHVDSTLRHAVGELLDRDGLRNDDLADHLLAGLVRLMALQALGAAAERGDRALTHVVGVERGDQRQAATLLLRRGLGGRLGRHHGTRGATGPTADLARTVILVRLGGNAGRAGGGGNRRARRRRGGRSRAGAGAGGGACRRRSRGLLLGFLFTETLLGFEFGLALGFCFQAMAVGFLALARFGGLALLLLLEFLGVAARGFFLGGATLFLFADLGVGERHRARAALVLGQGTQHHARTATRLLGRRTRRRSLTHGRRCRLGDGSFGGTRRCFRCGRRVTRKASLGSFLDHHRFGAAVAETLAHDAGLCARLQRQSFRTDAQRLVARILRFSHSVSPNLVGRARAASLGPQAV